MIQKTICRCICSGLFAAGTCLLSGCDDASKGLLRGAVETIGAQMVERSSDDDLRNMFKQANATCPQRIDVFTTLERVEMLDETHVEFHYLVSDQGKKMASRLDERAMKRAAVEQMKGNAMAVAVAERDLSIHHIYEDRSGNHILSYIINKAVLEGDLDPLGGERSNPFNVNTVKSGSGSSPRQQRNNRPRSNPAGVQDNPYF